MRQVILQLIVILCAAPFLNGQEQKTATREVQTAVDLYKERVSEGAKPTLTIKNGEAKLTEQSAQLSAGEFTTSFSPGEFAGEFKSAYTKEIEALKSQIETLKK